MRWCTLSAWQAIRQLASAFVIYDSAELTLGKAVDHRPLDAAADASAVRCLLTGDPSNVNSAVSAFRLKSNSHFDAEQRSEPAAPVEAMSTFID